jgi:hypothetical protein
VLDGLEHLFQFGSAVETQVVESADKLVEILKMERGIQHATAFSPRVIWVSGIVL